VREKPPEGFDVARSAMGDQPVDLVSAAAPPQGEEAGILELVSRPFPHQLPQNSGGLRLLPVEVARLLRVVGEIVQLIRRAGHVVDQFPPVPAHHPLRDPLPDGLREGGPPEAGRIAGNERAQIGALHKGAAGEAKQ